MLKLLLLTGIPGTGKTTLADHLVSHHGFVHFDRERFEHWPWLVRVLWDRAMVLFCLYAICCSHRVVISWGFLPGKDEPVIKKLQALGFTLFWFDGDRQAARKAFVKRRTVPLRAWVAQLKRINGFDLQHFEPVMINPFGPKGSFRSKKTLVAELFDVV